MLITIDQSLFPLVVVRYRGSPSVTEFEAYLAALRDVYRAGKKFGLVFDASGSEPPPAGHRKLQADFVGKHASAIRSLNVGTAFVVDSVLLRGALTAMMWLSPLPCPHHVCGDAEEAKRWVKGRLSAAGAG